VGQEEEEEEEEEEEHRAQETQRGHVDLNMYCISIWRRYLAISPAAHATI
jgi:hypothetical protein